MHPAPLYCLDRATGELRAEAVFGGGTLQFLHHRPLGRLLEQALACRMPFNRLYGWRQRTGRSRDRIAGFVASLGIDADEAELPLSAYRSLDEFFARRLRPGARPVDPTPAHLLAPGDGRLRVVALAGPALSPGAAGEAVPAPATELPVKGCRVGVAELCGDPVAAARFAGGWAFVLRLAPADYHRFHFPDDGVVGEARPLPGPLHSVHPIALSAGAPSLRNRRSVSWFASAGFGRLGLVEVGALVVGRILQTYQPGPVCRGDEKGHFRFGGSTVVLLVEPGRVQPDADLLAASARGLEALVRVGTRIGAQLTPGDGCVHPDGPAR